MTIGVLAMAYGSPDSLDQVGAYLNDIRGGRPIPPGLVEDLTERYRRIGGRSPLLEITRAQADALQNALGRGFRVAAGMKHWRPRIGDAIASLVSARVDRIVGVALAPHYARISIGGYAARARAALAELAPDLPFEMVPSWYDHPGFIDLVAANLREAFGSLPLASARVFFTAHSLPERILAEGDPYRDQLLASAKLVADAAGVADHSLAFQSVSDTGEPWLGPGLLEALSAYAAEGGARAVVCPIGFVSDHLEVLYDIDVEAAEHAARASIELRRVRSPNDDPRLGAVLADVVRSAVR